MRHPDEGQLRRLLDEPSALALSDREHVHECAQCGSDLDAMRRDADLVGAALWHGDLDVDVEVALQRLSTAEPRVGAVTPPPRRNRRLGLLRRPSTAVLAFVVALGGAGTAAANDWFEIFSTQRVAAVSITTADLVALPDLSAYGDLTSTQEPAVRQVPDAQAAAAATGLDLPRVAELPRGVSGEPTYQVGSAASATFTFSAESAARAAARTGEPLPPPPPGLDGSSVRLDAGPGAAQVWESDAGVPALVVGRAVAPTAFSTGVEFEVLRDYLLSLPGLPDGIADQLRAFAADGSTLPLPVPADEVTTSPTDVGGVPATLLTTRNRVLAAVVWVEDGVVTVVAGSLDDDEVLAVARGLR